MINQVTPVTRGTALVLVRWQKRLLEDEPEQPVLGLPLAKLQNTKALVSVAMETVKH